MSNTPLNADEELRESISQIQFDCWSDKGSHQPEKSSCQECNNQLTELVEKEIAKARIDELEKISEASKTNVHLLPEEPAYPSNLAVKSAVDEYNKKSSEYIHASFWFDMAFQPIHDYRRKRIAELKQELEKL